ncbi:hypothetical protein EIP86_002848 [Pleurotus ostreatoroseus]|nr:hypothetical protein EIP86_002848 [Pleurotus ostreatoroseus]
MSTHWRELVRDKRERQAQSIPKHWIISPPDNTVLDVTEIPRQCGLLTAKELEITETTDVATLLNQLASGELSSLEVTTAFCKRAIVAHQVVNCLTEIFVERALARAAEVDAYMKSTGKVMGPLHGLPISLKDQFRIKGLETTMGKRQYANNHVRADIDECTSNSYGAFSHIVVAELEFTHVSTKWAETYNKVYGRTVNPHNRSLTCGGSSGGEGALIAMKGSVLGVGSDIGGSIRVPSHMNGVYGLRPSYHRVPYAGAANSMEGQDSIPSVFGPLSSSITGIKIFMQAVASSQPWLRDPLARRKKWDEEEYSLAEHGGGKSLCFAIMWHDGVVVPHPPVTRAMEMTKAALLAAGHKGEKSTPYTFPFDVGLTETLTVIEWRPIKHRDLARLVYSVWTAGSAEDYKVVTSVTGEPVINSMKITAEEVDLDVNEFLPPGSVSAYQLWQIQKEKRDLRQEYLEHWNNTVRDTGTGRPVDAIIAPVSPFSAVPHGMNATATYTAVWNALDYPACVFPVTRVDPVLDPPRPPHDFIDDRDKENYEYYKPELFVNAPVGLQLVGRCQEEEAVIAMTEIVDAALKKAKSQLSKL